MCVDLCDLPTKIDAAPFYFKLFFKENYNLVSVRIRLKQRKKSLQSQISWVEAVPNYAHEFVSLILPREEINIK